HNSAISHPSSQLKSLVSNLCGSLALDTNGSGNNLSSSSPITVNRSSLLPLTVDSTHNSGQSTDSTPTTVATTSPPPLLSLSTAPLFSLSLLTQITIEDNRQRFQTEETMIIPTSHFVSQL
ncbi:hypothetical protein CFOL_v3_13222, partial [Cephalotus follicularis]